MTDTFRHNPELSRYELEVDGLLAVADYQRSGHRLVIPHVEADMALAAAVMKAVNSSLYGLAGRVQSVQQAITYLGTREVAAVTFEMGLKAVFPAAPELEAVWERASVRGLLMGRIGQAVARRAKAFGLQIHYHNRRRVADEIEQAARDANIHDRIMSFADGYETDRKSVV